MLRRDLWEPGGESASGYPTCLQALVVTRRLYLSPTGQGCVSVSPAISCRLLGPLQTFGGLSRDRNVVGEITPVDQRGQSHNRATSRATSTVVRTFLAAIETSQGVSPHAQ